MTRLLRIFRQNQIEIFVILSVIAFAIFVIHSLNEFTGISKNAENVYSQQNQITEQSNTINEESEYKKKIYSAMDRFVKYCNNSEYELAYSLLSNECKQNKYETADIFYARYIKTTFSQYLDYTMVLDNKSENMYTYKITFKTNAMATGNTSTSIQTQKGYYIFIIDETGNVKINIKS